MKHTITLPVNSTRVKTEEIPWIIAGAITPAEQASVKKITAILKRETSSETYYVEGFEYASTPQEPLTYSDWKCLYKICGLSGLPPLMKGGKLIDIKLSDWELYEKAFEKYNLKWMLLPFSNTELKIVADAHSEALINSILNNEVVVYDNLTQLPLQMPTKFTALKNTYMPLSLFKEYLAKCGLDIVVNNKATPVIPMQECSKCNTPPPCMLNGMNAINKLALETAWQIECDNNGIHAGAYEESTKVIKELRRLVSAAKPKITFLKELSEHGVMWATKLEKPKNYTPDACQKTLSRWYKRRDEEESNATAAVKPKIPK